MLELRSKNKVVGAKQTKKALQENRALAVYIAQDAELGVTDPIRSLCEQQGLSPTPVTTMAELGEACELKVGAAVAAVVKGS